MKGLIVILTLALCSGCASTVRWVEDNPEEAAWQLLHLADAAQTRNFTKNLECYSEGDKMTRLLVGEKPEKDRIYKWYVGSAIAHYLFFKAIEDTKFDKPLRVADMVFKVNIVYGNHQNGVRMTGDNVLPIKCIGGRYG